MSNRVQTAVGDLGAPTNVKFVLLKYADHADDQGRNTWPSYDRIARFTGLSVRTVTRIVGELRSLGVLAPQADGFGGRGKGGRGRRYCIDLGRARQVFGWYREDDGGKWNLVAPVETQDTASGVCDAETQDNEVKTLDTGDINVGQAMSAEPPLTNEPNARAREASGEAPASARATPETNATANAIWKAHAAEIEQLAVGQQKLKPWVALLTPLADDGETLTLGATTPMACKIVQQAFGPALKAVLGREIEVLQHDFSVAAAARRRTDGGDKNYTPASAFTGAGVLCE